MLTLLLALLSAQTTQPAPADAAPSPDAEAVRVVSYNIENFRENFNAFKLQRKYKGGEGLPDDVWELIRRERREDREENLEVAAVIEALGADVLALQESADATDLAYFNKEFLDGRYDQILQFPTNTTREQHLTLLLAPGYEVLETVSLHETPDTKNLNDREDGGEYLFARGPAFVKLRTPGGRVFWVGNTHQKSKGGNNEQVTRWRNAEGAATRDKAIELAGRGDADGPLGVLLVGDMNDQLGVQEFEMEGGGDVMENMSRGLDLLTRELDAAGATSFKGYGGTRHPSLIDHALATPALSPHVTDVFLFDGPEAMSASDHYPLVVDLTLP